MSKESFPTYSTLETFLSKINERIAAVTKQNTELSQFTNMIERLIEQEHQLENELAAILARGQPDPQGDVLIPDMHGTARLAFSSIFKRTGDELLLSNVSRAHHAFVEITTLLRPLYEFRKTETVVKIPTHEDFSKYVKFTLGSDKIASLTQLRAKLIETERNLYITIAKKEAQIDQRALDAANPPPKLLSNYSRFKMATDKHRRLYGTLGTLERKVVFNQQLCLRFATNLTNKVIELLNFTNSKLQPLGVRLVELQNRGRLPEERKLEPLDPNYFMSVLHPNFLMVKGFTDEMTVPPVGQAILQTTELIAAVDPELNWLDRSIQHMENLIEKKTELKTEIDGKIELFQNEIVEVTELTKVLEQSLASARPDIDEKVCVLAGCGHALTEAELAAAPSFRVRRCPFCFRVFTDADLIRIVW